MALLVDAKFIQLFHFIYLQDRENEETKRMGKCSTQNVGIAAIDHYPQPTQMFREATYRMVVMTQCMTTRILSSADSSNLRGLQLHLCC